MRRRIRAAALVMALVLLLGTVAAATDTTETTPKPIDYKNAPAQKNGIQVAPVADGCGVEFAGDSEALTVTYTNDEKLNVGDMVIVLLLKSDKAVTSDTEANDVATTLTAGTIQYINQADVTKDGEVTFRVFPQNYSNGVIRLIWKDKTSDGVNTATVAAVNRNYRPGDADRDGKVTAEDALAVLMYTVNNEKYLNIDREAADVSGSNNKRDGKVTAEDALAILLYTVNRWTFDLGD